MNTESNNESWAVIGGGFRGIAAAILLRKAGYAVTLIEQGKDLGGVMSSVKWKDFYLDKGCHLFSNTSDETTLLIMEVLGNRYVTVDVNYASVTNGIKTEGMAIPDLSGFGHETTRNILYELFERLAKGNSSSSPGNMQEALVHRFGNTAGSLLLNPVRKMYQCEPDQLDASAIALGMYSRIKFIDDEIGRMLKKLPQLDELVAVSSSADPMEFYRKEAKQKTFRNFYPANHGLQGFCESAFNSLQASGINIILNAGIEQYDFESASPQIRMHDGTVLSFNRVFWAAGLDTYCRATAHPDDITSYIHKVPMILHYFIINKEDEGPYSYIHDFALDHLVFRASVPGKYGKDNCPEGYSYVCSEVPVTMVSNEWNNAKDTAAGVYSELLGQGVVKGSKPVDSITVTIPATYRIPMKGFNEVRERILSTLPSNKKIFGLDTHDFAKADIVKSIREVLSGYI